MSLYQILAHQALSIVNYFFQAPLPDPAQVFPWIYSGANNQASSSHHHNSHFPNSKLATPQQLKSFVLFVRSAPIQDTSVPIIEDSALLKNSVDYFALLSPYDEMDVEESESKHINLRNFITNYLLYLDIITSEKDPYINTIMDDVLKVGRLPIFKDISNESFSIRSFNMQTNIISTISDFIVYCFNKDHLLDFDFSNHMQKSKATTCKCLCVSRLLNLAQIHFQKNNPEILHTESVQISATANPSGKLKPVEIQEDHCGEGLQESDDESEINFNSVLCALKKNEGFAVVHDDTEEVFENVIPHFKACKENFDQSKHSLFFSDEATVVTNPTKHFLQLPKLHCMTSSCNSMNSFYNTFIIERPMEILLNDEYFSSLISVPPYTNTGDELNINSLITNHLAEQRALPNGTTSNLLLLNLFEINSINNWEINYLIKEKLEIWKISSAQQFQPGLWIGNEGDYYMWKQLNENNKSAPDSINHYEPEETFENKVPKYCSIYNSLFLSDNPLVESHCNNRKLLNEPPVNWKFLIEVHATSKLPTLMKLYEIFSFIKACEKPKKHHMQIPYDTCITLQFPASGTIAGLGNLSVQDILIIINVCKVIYYKNHLVFPTLMFCPEGYTETALLAIIYLMYSTGTSLRDAIIDFYIKYGRPFYLFDNDYKLLLDLEAIILHYSPKNNMSVNDNELEELNDDNSNIISEILIKSFSQKRQSSNPEFVNPITNNDWFNELIANNSGSLVPSRILPNLFLGSLNHANSLPLLAKFKINTIVSVGETLPWFSFLPPEAYSINNTFGKSGTCHVIKFLKESPAALAKAPYLENFPIDQILLVNDIKDDGIDSISNDLLNDIFDFFTQYTQTDVNSITNFDLPQKTLVHCKVGVSRSATVVIAYLMRFLGMTLEKAYLFVRVRRLNIIIQPNLRLFYGLFKIQEELLVKFHSQEDANKSSKRRFFNSHTTDGPYQFSIPRRKKSSVSSSSMDNSSLYSDEYYYTPGISAGSYISNGSGKQPIRFIRNREASNASSLQTSITIDSNNSEDEQDFEEDDDSVVVDSSDDNYEPPEPFSKPKTISTISADPAHKSNGSSKLTKSFDQFTKLNGEHAKTQLVNSKWLRNVDWVIFCQRVHELNKF